jgi:hypothetical protein
MIYEGRTILITGGASGIGLALAERFARAKNKVIVCGRREAALAAARTLVPGLHTLRADVSTARERVALFERVTREHPELDVLVNNAGVQNHLPPLTETQEWSQHAHEIETNLGAPMHLAMLFLPHLLSRPEAAILNVSSGLRLHPDRTDRDLLRDQGGAPLVHAEPARGAHRHAGARRRDHSAGREHGARRSRGSTRTPSPSTPYADDVMRRLLARRARVWLQELRRAAKRLARGARPAVRRGERPPPGSLRRGWLAVGSPGGRIVLFLRPCARSSPSLVPPAAHVLGSRGTRP